MEALSLLREFVGNGREDPEEICDDIISAVGDAEIVLLGEATHGTREFYELRSHVTKRLIEEYDFDALALEADWPDTYRVNEYVKWFGDGNSAEESLGEFSRFPSWMWRNHTFASLVEWMREFNEQRPEQERVGVYGLDLYSMFGSIDAVLEYLNEIDPEAAARAKERYSCFDHFESNPQGFGLASALGLTEDCERDALEQLEELNKTRRDQLLKQGTLPAEEHMSAVQNARIVTESTNYYRALFGGRHESWNIRDSHMATTLEDLREYFRAQRQGRDSGRIVVWAHNSHVGDARATEMARRGEISIGQLARERYGDRCRLIGFTTFAGTVTAASEWARPSETKTVKEGLPGSYEELFHAVGASLYFLPIRDNPMIRDALAEQRLERAIGVVYLPHTERHSHYFESSMASQFDAVVHIDHTHHVEPLETLLSGPPDFPETFPAGV